MQNASLRRRSLVDDVAERLSKMLTAGGLVAGDRLPTEAQLVSQLGVSRNALREAIRRLETVGTIQVRHGFGMFLGGTAGLSGCAKLFRSAMSMSGKDVTEVAELRCLIEYHTVRRAAQRATPEQVAELHELLMLAAKEDQTREQAVRSDFEFHRKISEMAGNQLMSSLMTILEELLLSVMEKATEIPRAFRQNFELHFPIWEAVRDRDADAAERAMHEHMRLFFMRVEQNLSIPKSIDD